MKVSQREKRISPFSGVELARIVSRREYDPRRILHEAGERFYERATDIVFVSYGSSHS